MGWRETWRETMESFVRELRADDGDAGLPGDDPVVRAVAGARAELTAVERELSRTVERLDHEEAAAAVCARRREMADRIGDASTATVAARFQHRHEERAALLRRKRDVLRDERALARIALEELGELLRAEPASDVDDDGFRDLEDARRERAAAERLDELKRRGD